MKKPLTRPSPQPLRQRVRLNAGRQTPIAKSFKVSDAVLLAVASALSYAVAYAYQSGFASHFGLPPLLLSPTIGSILQAGAAVGIVLMAFWNFASVAWHFSPRGDTALKRAIRRIIALALVFGLLLFPILDSKSGWIVFAFMLFLFVFLEFVFPLITQRKIIGYENKLLEQEEIERHVAQHSLVEHAVIAFGKSALRLAVAAVLLIFISYSVGLRAAIKQEEFFVLTDRPGYVVAAMEDNLLILAAYIPTTLVLTGTYHVERLSDSREWTLKQEHIGKLTAAPKIKASSPRSTPSSNAALQQIQPKR